MRLQEILSNVFVEFAFVAPIENFPRSGEKSREDGFLLLASRRTGPASSGKVERLCFHQDNTPVGIEANRGEQPFTLQFGVHDTGRKAAEPIKAERRIRRRWSNYIRKTAGAMRMTCGYDVESGLRQRIHEFDSAGIGAIGAFGACVQESDIACGAL